VVAEAGGTAGLAWDERNRLRRDTAGRDSRVTAGFSALARGRPARRGLRRGGAGGAGVDMASAAAMSRLLPLAFTPIARLFETVRGHNPSLGC